MKKLLCVILCIIFSFAHLGCACVEPEPEPQKISRLAAVGASISGEDGEVRFGLRCYLKSTGTYGGMFSLYYNAGAFIDENVDFPDSQANIAISVTGEGVEENCVYEEVDVFGCDSEVFAKTENAWTCDPNRNGWFHFYFPDSARLSGTVDVMLTVDLNGKNKELAGEEVFVRKVTFLYGPGEMDEIMLWTAEESLVDLESYVPYDEDTAHRETAFSLYEDGLRASFENHDFSSISPLVYESFVVYSESEVFDSSVEGGGLYFGIGYGRYPSIRYQSVTISYYITPSYESVELVTLNPRTVSREYRLLTVDGVHVLNLHPCNISNEQFTAESGKITFILYYEDVIENPYIYVPEFKEERITIDYHKDPDGRIILGKE